MNYMIVLSEYHNGSCLMIYNNTTIGRSKYPYYDSSRWLLDNYQISETDTLTTVQNGTVCMSGKILDASKYTIREDKSGIRRVKYAPFGENAISRRSVEAVGGQDDG